MGGAECVDISNKSYEDKIEELHNETIKPIETKFSDKNEGEVVLLMMFTVILLQLKRCIWK